MLKARSSLLALGLTGVLAGPALADTVTFKNGREVHGRLIEETKDEIIVQVGQGKLRFAKREVATFTEDNDYGQRYFTPPHRSDAYELGGPGGAAMLGKYWTRHKDAGQDELKDLKGVHAKLEEEYVKLGASPEARARKLELTGSEKTQLDNTLVSFGRVHGVGDVSGFGLKAIPSLVEVLQSGDMVAKATAAMAIADVYSRGELDDARWICGKVRAGVVLTTLLEASGDETAGSARTAADKALQAVSGTQFNWQDSKDPYPTESQRESIRSWKLWASKDAATFQESEKKFAEGTKKLDEMWKALEDPKMWRDALILAKDTYGVATPAGGKDEKAPSKDSANDVVNSDVAKAASPEDQQKISALKSKIRTTLEKTVGPSIDDLKAKYQLSSEDRQDVDAKIHASEGGQKRGRNEKVDNAIDELANTYGLKALDACASALDGDNPMQRRALAVAIGKMATGANKDDAVRMIYAAKVPGKIVNLLDESSIERAATVRTDANKSLEQITGTSVGWAESEDQQPTEAQLNAALKWRSWVSKFEADAAKREKAREDHRKKLSDFLKDLDRGSKWKDALEKAPKELEQTEKDLKV